MATRDPLGIAGQLIAEKYQVEALVGEGGFAAVYRAQHVIWNKPVAIKFFSGLSQAPLDQRDELQRAFVQEGALLTELSTQSAGIVQARDVGAYTTPSGQWTPYLVLEWLDGKPFEAVLEHDLKQGQPWSVHDTLGFLQRVLPALQVAHSRGVAHRDIKPANLFVLGSAARSTATPIKLLDFGVAKMATENTQIKAALAKTGLGISSFTPKYGAPEQFARSYGATGPWTDVYAMALVATEMLSGRDALDGDDLVQLGFATGNPEVRPTPRTRGARIPDALEAVFARALAVHPEQRYASAGEFLEGLLAASADSFGNPRPTAPSYPGAVPPSSGFGQALDRTVLDTRVNAATVRADLGAVAALNALSKPTLSQPGAVRPSLPSAPGAFGPGERSSSEAYDRRAGTVSVPVPVTHEPPKKKGGWFTPLLALLVLVGGATAVYAVSGLRGSDETKQALLKVAEGAKNVAETAKSAAEKLQAPAPSNPNAAASALNANDTQGAASASSAAAAPSAPKCPTGMLAIAAAEFTLGSDAAADPEDTHPAHAVSLDAYCIDQKEVTTASYRSCVAKGRCAKPAADVAWPGITAAQKKAYDGLCTFAGKARGNQPINCVSWAQASAYCEAQNGRLPTEAEWEYAARGKSAGLYPWGDEEPTSKHLNACGKECVAWSTSKALGLMQLYPQSDGFPNLAPVGSFALGRSSFGLDDMAGNAAEWVFDRYGPYPTRGTSDDPVRNPEGLSSGERRSVRGASYTGGYASHYRALVRGSELESSVRADLGFRCAKAAP